MVHPKLVNTDEFEKLMHSNGQVREVAKDLLSIKEHMVNNHLGLLIQNTSKDTNLSVKF